MSNPILQTHQLNKLYRKSCVVENLNLRVEPGDIYGLLGQNGAGKTTTLRMLLGLVKPTSGQIEWYGHALTRPLYGRIGSIIETPGFYPQLTAAENLELHRRMSGIPEKGTVMEYLKLVGLEKAAHRKAKQLSLGMKQRLGIARAMMHRPDMLILDEPINGLDPLGIKETRELIVDLQRKREITVLISSHILGEIQLMASRIGIMHQGRLIEQLDYEDIQGKNRHYLELKIDDEKRTAVLLERELHLTNFQVCEQGMIRLYEGFQDSGAINRRLVEAGIEVKELTIQTDSLEDFFIRATTRKELA
ncbi:ABC transporter ATP-binding protein [Paenibacillus albidus]|uniref:ABC transporter ATP-binding protein n=1 Tax=Paenibacillus albidus TaxID=2041023 RepID=UPI00288BFC0C|nr:ABC transporter ATP-binding protein [Paenibacillus albidus]